MLRSLATHLVVSLSFCRVKFAVVCADVQTTESQTWYSCCETPFARMTFSIWLRRKPTYYVINLLIPSIIFSFLTLISLILQPGSSDRIALGTLIAHTALLHINVKVEVNIYANKLFLI